MQVRVIVKRIGETPRIEWIDNNDFTAIQKFTEGCFEVAREWKLGEMYINEEGLVNGMEPHFYLPNAYNPIVHGPIVIGGRIDDNGDSMDLTDDEIMTNTAELLTNDLSSLL